MKIKCPCCSEEIIVDITEEKAEKLMKSSDVIEIETSQVLKELHIEFG